MRITAELINKSPQFFNPLHERELDLRGYRIAVIENLGITEDAFDTIDLSENELTSLDNVPLLPRLRSLMLSRNRINSIGDLLAANAPNLNSIVFTENELSNIDALRPLQNLVHLTRLSLLDNPVMHLPDARLAIIQLLPQLRVLNFHRVRQRERAAATAKFGASKPPSRKRALNGAPASAAATSAVTPTIKAPAQVAKRTKLSTAQQAELAQKIANASSMEEIARLEAALRENRMPE